jgi:uncharacterized damage-inducible protein DinB
MSAAPVSNAPVVPADALLEHWQGHRRLTRRVIDAFPDDKLFTFSIGGMRSFGTMAIELLSIGTPLLKGIVTGHWEQLPPQEREAVLPKSELLRRWDADTLTINELWTHLTPERFQETMTAFGQYPGKVYDLLLYGIDNEIHHRGEGFVYLRALGIEPPPFYERN